MQHVIHPDERQQKIDSGVRLWWRKFFVLTAIMWAFVFLVSGDTGWQAGSVYWMVLIASQLVVGLILGRKHPDLLAERSKPQEGMKKWDLLLAGLGGAWLPLLGLLVACLDHRNSWSMFVPVRLQITGLVLIVVGVAITTWSMFANRFFSGVVRIQEDRDHHVIDSGPYRIVRHPGYVGAILYDLGFPLLLSSGWAMIPAVGAIIVLLYRTSREDATLQDELPGYADYARRTKYRLLPKIW